MASTRRLAAILAADVAGYSRLIGSDEQGTLQRLKSIRAELIDPAIATHHGRVVKTTGDGLLAEFASTVDALRCAGEMQTQMAERNFALAPDTRIEMRIGIHQGDIVVEDDGDIFGDGVNIAAPRSPGRTGKRLRIGARPGGRRRKALPCVPGSRRKTIKEHRPARARLRDRRGRTAKRTCANR